MYLIGRNKGELIAFNFYFHLRHLHQQTFSSPVLCIFLIDYLEAEK